MEHKLYKFIEVVENTQSYKTDVDFQKDFKSYVDDLLASGGVVDEDSILLNLKDLVNKNYPIIYQLEVLPETRLFEAIEDELGTEEEAEEEENFDDIDIDNPNADEENDLAMIDEPTPAEDGLTPPIEPDEKGSDIDPEEKVLNNSDSIKKKEFEENLEQIDKNLLKIKELDSTEELEDLFLKELGKKYVIEQEIQKLGTSDEFSVENSIDSIFESKQEDKTKFVLNHNKTLKNFRNKFTKLNEAKSLFDKVVKDKILSKLNENLEVILDESEKQFSIYKLDGLDDRLCMRTNFELPENFDDIVSREDGFFTFDIKDLTNLISKIKSYSYYESSDKFVLEIDGSYVSMDDESLDLVDNIEDTDTVFDTEDEANTASTLLYESMMTKFNVKRVVPTPNGSVVLSDKFQDNKYFKLNESYVVKGEVLARKGYPVELMEKSNGNYKFSTINSKNKNIALFEDNILIEAMLEPITQIEHDSLKTDVIIEDTILDTLKELCESKGKKLTFKKNAVGRKLYESAFVDDHNVISKEIGDVDEFEKMENIEDYKELTDEESLDFVLNNEKEVVDAISNVVENDVVAPTIEIQNVQDDNILSDLPDGKELKLSTDVYKDIEGNITNFSNGGDNDLLFAKNTVVKFYNENGVTSNDGLSWEKIPMEYLTDFVKFDVDSLEVGKNYMISDLENEVSVEFVGAHDVEDTILYEFLDLVNQENYYLKYDDVSNNVK